MKKLEVSAFLMSQPIGDFFVAKIKADDLVRISYSDIRTMSNKSEVETYLGIQRPLNTKRAKEIQSYVKNVDASFPSSIILSLEESDIEWDERNKKLVISYDDENSPAKILDGQHRIAGFMDLDSGKPVAEQCYFDKGSVDVPFELIITIFVGLDITEQATIFGTVNIKQTKVSKSLVYDLETYSKSRSPQKTAHDIVIALDRHPKSPFSQRIKRLGLKESSGEILTQAALVEDIIVLISDNAMLDRDVLLRREKSSFSLSRESLERTGFQDGLVFRNLFIDDKDEEILKIILFFFLEVQDKWPSAWSDSQSIFCKTVGVKGLFRVLRELCKTEWAKDERGVIDAEFFKSKFMAVEIDAAYFFNLPAKSTSTKELFIKIYRQIQLS